MSTASTPTPWFESLDPKLSARARRRLRHLGDEIIVEAGSIVIDRGARAEYFHLLVDGTVDVEVEGARVATLHSGEFFGEVAMLYQRPAGPGHPPEMLPRTATVRATRTSRIHRLDRAELMTLMDVSRRASAAWSFSTTLRGNPSPSDNPPAPE